MPPEYETCRTAGGRIEPRLRREKGVGARVGQGGRHRLGLPRAALRAPGLGVGVVGRRVDRHHLAVRPVVGAVHDAEVRHRLEGVPDQTAFTQSPACNGSVRPACTPYGYTGPVGSAVVGVLAEADGDFFAALSFLPPSPPDSETAAQAPPAITRTTATTRAITAPRLLPLVGGGGGPGGPPVYGRGTDGLPTYGWVGGGGPPSWGGGAPLAA